MRLQLAYDGSRFFGWQRQEGFRSVQQSIEEAFHELTGASCVVHGAGRTDTGVHALRQVAHAHVATRLEDDRLRHALNAHLGPGVVVRRLETCRDDFHARFDARGKRYGYWTATTRFRPPIGLDHVHWIPEPLDLEAMRRAAAAFVGRQDFRALASSGSEREDTVRTISSIRFLARRERFGVLVQGDGFLYNMVRTLVGTLIEVGRGKWEPEVVPRILASRDRREAGPTAPACGLYLLTVRYAEPCFVGPDAGPRGSPGVFSSGP